MASLADLEPYYLNAAVALLTVVSHLWMRLQLNGARKKFNIPSDVVFAEEHTGNSDHHAFNHVQRAIFQSGETAFGFYVLFFFASSVFPLPAAALGGTYAIGQLIEFTSCSAGSPNNFLGRLLEFSGVLGLIAAILKYSTDNYINVFAKPMIGFGLVLVALASYARAKAGHIQARPHHHHRKAHRE